MPRINDIPRFLYLGLTSVDSADKKAVAEWLKTHSDNDVIVALWEAIDPSESANSGNVYSRHTSRSA